MSEDPEVKSAEDLAEFLVRFYGAEGGARREEGPADPNDLAAWATGRLEGAAAARMARLELSRPEVREALAIEDPAAAALRARPARRRALVAASVVAALALALAIPLVTGDGPSPGGDAPTLEELSECHRLDAAELAVLEGRLEAALRSGRPPEDGPRVVAPGGLILSGRPALTVRPGEGPASITLFRNHDQHTLVLERLGGEVGPESTLRIPFPDDHPPLEPGVRYGVDVRDADGRLVASSNFVVADLGLRRHCEVQRAHLERLVGDEAQRLVAFGSMLLRHDLFADALEALRRVPAAARDAYWYRVTDLARRHLAP